MLAGACTIVAPRRLLALVALAVVGLAALPALAAAITPQNVTVTQTDTRANAHADLTIGFDFGNASEQVRDLRLHLPAGVIGNPRNADVCPQANLAADSCPASSQVGTTAVTATALGLPTTSPGTVYNVETTGDEAARLGIVVRPLGGALGKITLQSPIFVRDSTDYGLDSTVANIPNTLSGIPITVTHMDLTLSGRAGTGRPFMTNPSSCAPKQLVVEADSYASSSFNGGSGSMQSTDCQDASLPANLTIRPDDPNRDIGTGLGVVVDVPEDLGDRAPSQVRSSELNFPTGLALNPSGAPSLGTCDDDAFGPQGDENQCPANSQVGTISFTSPPLGVLPGNVYLAPQPQAGQFLLLIDVSTGSTRVKLKLLLSADKQDGHITARFVGDLPEVPVAQFNFHFNGGDNPMVATPTGCGSYTSTAQLQGWSGEAPTNLSTQTQILPDGDGTCSPPARIDLNASPANRPAGSSTSLDLAVSRPQGSASLDGINATLPNGLSGILAGQPRCSDAAAADASCPANTRVGSITTLVGEGSHPAEVDGDVYLGGPVNGSLASLVIGLPGKLGPIDLGRIAIRAPLDLGRRDGRVVVNAPVPELVSGVALRVQKIDMNVNKSGFLLSPTGCQQRPLDVTAQTASGSAQATTQTQATGCERLPFRPTVIASVPTPDRAQAGDRVPLDITVTMPPGQSNLASTQIGVPRALQPDIQALNRTCQAGDLDADRCPPVSIIGTARADTPLLDQPLAGNVFFAQTGAVPARSTGLNLPYLVVDLRGQTRLRLDGEQRLIATGPLQTTLAGLPDVPLSSFALDVASGQASPFTLQNDLCSQPLPPLDTTLIAQNGATVSQEVPIERPACGDVPTLQVAAKRLATSHRRVTAEVDPAGGKAADRLTLTLPADLRLAPGAKARNVVARLNRKRIASSRVRLHGVHQIEVRAPHEGTLALVLDRQAIELSMAGKRRQGDATTTDLDFDATIRSDGAQQHVAATATATYR